MEFTFLGSPKTFQKHAMSHDIFGNFYLDFGEGLGLNTGDLVTFTEEILNGKLHFLCSICLNAVPMRLPSLMRTCPLMGHISGLILCFLLVNKSLHRIFIKFNIQCFLFTKHLGTWGVLLL